MKKTYCNGISKASILLFSLLQFTLCFQSAKAQLNESTFDLQKASELYDERGFMKGKSLSLDGNLVVNNSNGNINYTYPISSFNLHGYPMNVSLNYCGSVGFTAFQAYQAYNQNACPQGWSKTTENKPLWIIGLNGFAIQTISQNTEPICAPSHIQAYWAYGEQPYEPEVWLVDGYDFCNRTKDIRYTCGTCNEFQEMDIIKLLRSDGSVLELCNHADSTLSAFNYMSYPYAFSGKYFEKGTNAKGYAYVELEENRQQSLINKMAGFGFSSADAIQMPRIVHYYPGDGLEYVFREDVAPYGTQFYLGAETEGDWYGKIYAQHTIFYLDKIRSEKRNLIELNYDDDNIQFNGDYSQILRGRKQVSDFYGHKFTFSQIMGRIESFGKTIDIRFDTILRAPKPDSYVESMLTGANWEATSLPMIKRIIDPAGRQISFDYGTRTRRYTQYSWPYQYSTSGCVTETYSPIFKTKTKRMTRFNEPTAYTQISYFRNDSVDVVHHLSPPYSDSYLLSDVAKTVVKKNYEGSSMLTKQFAFNPYDTTAAIDLLGTPEWDTYYTVTDNITNQRTHTISSYKRFKIDGTEISSAIPGSSFTDLVETIEGSDSIKTKTQTTYDWLRSPSGDTVNFRLPVARTITEYTSTDTVKRAYSTFKYEVDTMVHFTMSLPKKYYGFGVTRQYENIWRPDTTTSLLYRKITDYQIFPDSMHTMYILHSWDKITSLQKFYELKRTDPSFTKTWEECIETVDTRVMTSFDNIKIDTVHSFSPAAYMEKSSYITDGDSASYPTTKGKILQGTSRKFVTLCTDNPSHLDRVQVLEDTVFGKGGEYYISSQSQYDINMMIQSPSAIKNANGGITDFRYQYNEIPESWSSSFDGKGLPLGKIHRNDNTDSIGNLHGGEHVVWWHEPLAEAKRIRRYLPTHEGIDTMILTTLFERTYYGLHSGVIDANGWLTSARYDALGRLTKLSFPYDYNSASHLIEYEKTVRSVRESGYTVLEGHRRYHRQIKTGSGCNGGWEDTVVTIQEYPSGDLHAEKRYDVDPDPPENRKKEGATPLEFTCNWSLVDTSGKWSDSTYYAVIPFSVDNSNILSLDSAVIELSPTIIDPCLALWIEGRKVLVSTLYEYSDTVVLNQGVSFNCDSAYMDSTWETVSDTGVVVVREGMKIRIKLSSGLKSEIVSSGLNFKVRLDATTGFTAGYFHNSGDEVMPQIKLYGVFKDDIDLTDYTLKYTYGDYFGKGRIYRYAKVDDTLHTSSSTGSGGSADDNRRVSLSSTLIADDNCISENVMYRGNPTDNVTEIVRDSTNGLGKVIKVIDQLGYVSRVKYDEFGRVVQVNNPDNINFPGDTNTKVTTFYDIGKQQKFGILPQDQDFLGFCSIKSVKNEYDVIFTQYSDALGRLRREVADSGSTGAGHLHYITKYEYDILSRLTKVTNPAGQVTQYWYDDFGRVKYKKQPDLGILSYSYDAMGNVRFTQTNEQDSLGTLTFHEYDDLNRITVVGEARLGAIDHDTLPYLNRWTDVLDPNVLHDNGTSDILTANKTLWDTSLTGIPYLAANATASSCPPVGGTYDTHHDHSDPDYGYVYTGQTFKQILGTVGADTLIYSDTTNFERISHKPQNVRIVIHYDTVPQRAGAVWGHYTPSGLESVWDDLCPTGSVRNMKGHEVAVAYRDKANEPFHYVTMSYDERGRVEALLRFTDNIGFDAVYYNYNSANQVIKLTTADGMRTHTTWYGYDWNGRIDSVWSRLDSGGLGMVSPQYPTIQIKPADTAVSIVYRYDKRGLIDSTLLPQALVVEKYNYGARKWLDSMTAHRDGAFLFCQNLRFDKVGNIARQTTKQGAADSLLMRYNYDHLNRLTFWTDFDGYNYGEHYDYDSVGNRTELGVFRTGDGDIWHPSQSYSYAPGKNQLTAVLNLDNPVSTIYKYTGDGALRVRQKEEDLPYSYFKVSREVFGYGYNGLLKTYGTSSWEGSSIECRVDTVAPPQWLWKYRYSAGGERESKRLIVSMYDSLGFDRSHSWTYYLLGGNKQQLAVYNGREITTPNACLDSVHRVHFYPTEYLTYGNGGSALISMRPNGKPEYKIVDHLGSTRVVLNDTGSVIMTMDFEPFGKEFDAPATGVRPRKSYIDREMDRESGLGYFGARYYDPFTGRFYSVDPLWEDEEQRGLSTYHYCKDNPLIYKDPDGKFWNFVIGAAIGATVEIGAQLLTEGKVTSWTRVGVSTAAGALTSGLSSLGTRVIGGAVISVAEGYINSKIEGKEYTAESATRDALFGAGGGLVGHVVEKATSKVGAVVKAEQKLVSTTKEAERKGSNLKLYKDRVGRAEKKLEAEKVKRTAPLEGAVGTGVKIVSDKLGKKEDGK